MPNTPSITIIKRFPYKGQPEEFSNTYHFNGSAPSDDAGWKALADAIFASESTMYRNEVVFVRYYGYAAGNDHAVSQHDYTLAGGNGGTGSRNGASGFNPQPGDCAWWIRGLVGKSSKGKNVYVRKYFHGINDTDGDAVDASTQTVLKAHATKLVNGTLPGGVTWAGPQGAAVAAGQTNCSAFKTTRTLKRRGARPH